MDVAVSALTGLGFGLSLIVAIGAQNALVLRQGLRREHVGVVVLICALSDLLLIAAGVGGIGLLIERVPALVTVVRIAGAVFLIVYAAFAARRALRPQALDAQASAAASSVRTVAVTALALTWLNPHVYLDTVLLLGTIASGHGDLRWAFAVGAGLGSILWFTALGYGARLLAPAFVRPAAWRILDAAIAIVMIAIAAQLLLGL